MGNEMKKDILIEITVEERQRWNNTVKALANYEVFYLIEYVEAFMKEDIKNGIPTLFLYQNNNEYAINVVFKRDIAKDKNFQGIIPEHTYYDLITPYGYGGFFGEISNYQILNKVYNEYCIQNKYICEFVRFELFSNYYNHYEGEVETKSHNVVRSLENSLEEIWMDFKHKVRKNVKHALKNSLSISIDNSKKNVEFFLDIYYSTMKRSGASKEYYFSREFFETLNQMQNNITYFYVLYQNKVISTELVISGSENCYSYLGGTHEEYFNLRPNDFLKYEIVKWAKAQGFKNYILGGGYGSDDGIYQYKVCLAPSGIKSFYIGKKIFNQEVYNQLVEMRRRDNPACDKAGFFPAYRA